MNKNYLIYSMVLLVIIVGATVGYSLYKNANPPFSGSLITPTYPAPEFSLTSQSGSTVKLSDFRGKYVLIYFGFTHCTNECPLTMGYLKQMHDKLGPLADKTQVILITTDPARDTPQVLGAYLDHFDPSFVGLSATREVLQPVWSAYGVTVLDNGETHTSYLYLVDPQGNLMATYPLLSNSDDIIADIRHLINKQ